MIDDPDLTDALWETCTPYQVTKTKKKYVHFDNYMRRRIFVGHYLRHNNYIRIIMVQCSSDCYTPSLINRKSL